MVRGYGYLCVLSVCMREVCGGGAPWCIEDASSDEIPRNYTCTYHAVHQFVIGWVRGVGGKGCDRGG